MFARLTKRPYLTALCAILILGAVGFAFYRMVYLPTRAANAAKMASQSSRTAVAQQGDLTVYARGNGTLVARDEIKLGFGTGGPIAKLNARTGDKVHKGDVLAVQANRDRLQAAVVTDEISVLNAKIALQDLIDNSAAVAAQAQLDLANATAALNTAESKRFFQQQGHRASSFTVGSAEAALVVAQNALAQANASYDHIRPSDDAARAQARVALAAAQTAYDSAARSLAWYTGKPTPNEQALLDAQVALAKAQLAQAQRGWERVKDGPDPNKVTLAKLQVAGAEANLALSQRTLEASMIAAPMDGTILSVAAKVGDDVSAPFISMADLSQQYLTISLDGTAIDKIALDRKVEVTFDALPNQLFTGHVIQIDPNLYTPTGERIAAGTPGQITVVKALASLDQNTKTTVDSLPLGMTATVDVIGGQAQGVILVPVEALHEQSPGQYTVLVTENGKQKLRPVTVGLKGSSFVEIKSGLRVGEIVATSPVNTK